MIFRPKGRDDCCCKSWKDKINELWEKYQGVVKGVKAGSVTAYPDGDGIADLDGAVADAIAQQVPPMLTDLVTETELSAALEDYPTETELSQTLEDYATQTDLETKQDVLVSGQTIRTINGRDLLGEGNLQFNDILPDFSEAAEGDALVIGSEGLPEWGDVDPLPDTAEASTGDALVLDENKEPVWAELGGFEYLTTYTKTVTKRTYNIWNQPFDEVFEIENDKDYLLTFSVGTSASNARQLGVYPRPGETTPFGVTVINVGGADNPLSTHIYTKPGTGHVIMIPFGYVNWTPANVTGFIKVTSTSPTEPTIERGSLVPITTSATVGKFVCNTSGSNIEWANVLPSYSAADAGKVLSVNSSGELEWITLP